MRTPSRRTPVRVTDLREVPSPHQVMADLRAASDALVAARQRIKRSPKEAMTMQALERKRASTLAEYRPRLVRLEGHPV